MAKSITNFLKIAGSKNNKLVVLRSVRYLLVEHQFLPEKRKLGSYVFQVKTFGKYCSRNFCSRRNKFPSDTNGANDLRFFATRTGCGLGQQLPLLLQQKPNPSFPQTPERSPVAPDNTSTTAICAPAIRLRTSSARLRQRTPARRRRRAPPLGTCPWRCA